MELAMNLMKEYLGKENFKVRLLGNDNVYPQGTPYFIPIKQMEWSNDSFFNCRKEAFPEPTEDNEEKLILFGELIDEFYQFINFFIAFVFSQGIGNAAFHMCP